ncbi:MAG TPA: class I SAM-dependent methyltransferase [Telluria sp.]|jgi:ubiquinone/menaquinone biosynthesis C-methylase UbiE
MSAMTAEMETLKTRLKATWMSGDYAHFAGYLEPEALAWLQRLEAGPGVRMLDVGCGAGQIAIPAARAGAAVTGIDIASNLIAHARERAAREGVKVQFDEGDAEQLPYPDGSFNLVVSLIGAMFAPRPDLVAAELLRVCERGGRLAMANWTPQGHVGQMFKIIAGYVPPSPLMVSPLKWGDEDSVRERLGAGTSTLALVRKTYPMQYPFPPAEVAEFFFSYYGPTLRALAALEGEAKDKLRKDLAELWARNNEATDGSTVVNAEYLDVSAVRN